MTRELFLRQLATPLALNGIVVLVLSMLAGLALYWSIRRRPDQVAAWHLLHAGGAGRGVLLIALASILEFPLLTKAQLTSCVWLILFFVWTSMLAMMVRAFVGARGLTFSASAMNKLVYLLYALGTIAIFPACLLLIFGLLRALQLQS